MTGEFRRILAVESSCDEFGAAVIERPQAPPGGAAAREPLELRSNVVASQVDVHARTGGVVPEVAGREHLRNLAPVLEAALERAGCGWGDIDAVAVTQGPGLGGSLLVGVNAAKAAAWARGLPLVPVHHIEGHIYANWLRPACEPWDGAPPPFPALALVVSGGHTELYWMSEADAADPAAPPLVERIGQTRDDAAGEAFDKVGRLLGLPFPGGPAIERAARDASPAALEATAPFPRAWLPGTWDFSFSGVKTAVLNRARAERLDVPAAAARFQESVVDVLSRKTAGAAAEFGARSVIAAGGVAANSALRGALAERCHVPVRVPPPALCTDNAAMIGAAAFHRTAVDDRDGLSFDVFSTSGARVFSPSGAA